MIIHDSLGYLLNTSARLIKRKLDFQLREHNVTTAQWAVIKLLSAHERLSQAEIAEKLHADRATSGSVIDKLVQKELVQKTISQSDRRSYLVELLPSGRNIANEITILAEEVNSTAVKGIAEKDVTQLHLLLNTIISNMEESGYAMEK